MNRSKLILSIFILLICSVLSAETVLDQARKLVSDKKIDEAIQLLKSYDKEHPNDVDVHELIQRIMTRNDRKTEAVAEYKQRYEAQPTALNGYLYARLLDQPSDQEKLYREVIAKEPASVWG